MRIFFPFSFWETAATGSAPTVSTVDVAISDTLGGSFVPIHGTNFTGATAVHFGAVAATAFAVISDSLIYAVAPAQGGGSIDVHVTNGSGTGSTTGTPFVYWDPSVEVSCTLFLDRGDYVQSHGWDARVGSDALTSTSGTWSDESNLFPKSTLVAGHGGLKGPDITTLWGATAGTVACVFRPTGVTTTGDQTGTPYNFDSFFTNQGTGPFSVWAGSYGGLDHIGAHVYDTTAGFYRIAQVTGAPGTLIGNSVHNVTIQSSSSSVSIAFDGAAPTTIATSSRANVGWSSGNDAMILSQYDSTVHAQGDAVTIAVFNDSISLPHYDAWARVRHGGQGVSGAPEIHQISSDVVDPGVTTSIVVQGKGFTGVTDVRLGVTSCSFYVISDTRLVVLIPSSSGTFTLAIKNASGWSQMTNVIKTANPKTIGTCVWWVRGDQGTTVTNGFISAWNDASGSGDANRNLGLTDGTNNYQTPQFTASDHRYNGKATVGPFDTGPFCMSSPAAWGTTYAEPFSEGVIGHSKGASNRYFLFGNVSHYCAIVNSSGTPVLYATNGTTSITCTSGGDDLSEAPALGIGVFDGSSSEFHRSGYSSTAQIDQSGKIGRAHV